MSYKLDFSKIMFHMTNFSESFWTLTNFVSMYIMACNWTFLGS